MAGNAGIGISEPQFRAAVERLRVPGMGTEVVAPMLALLVQLLRPQRVLEVGMGYTTPFLVRALAEVEAQVAAEVEGLVGKTEPYLAGDRELDDAWMYAEPALLTPTFYAPGWRPQFVAVDDLSGEYTSAHQVGEVLSDLGLDGRVTLVNADLRESVPKLPAGFVPIDFAWVDTWDCLWFFEHLDELINPDGGILAMHYLMTYPEGEAILEYIAETQHLRPGEFEVLNLLESQKLRQNSLTVIRRTSGVSTQEYGEVGHKARFDGRMRTAAETLAGAVRPTSTVRTG